MEQVNYEKLRKLCLHEDFRADYPGWPLPFLFQGEEITRDIFFLDPSLEYGVIDLGRNPIRDASYFRYRSLNLWFHYRFFNGWNAITYSAEGLTLLPRLYRLHSAVLQETAHLRLADYLGKEFSIGEPKKLIATLLVAIERIIEICSRHEIVIWGIRLNEGAVQMQRLYIRDIVQKIPGDLVMQLPHIRPLVDECKRILKKEEKEFRKGQARVNTVRKRQGRMSKPGYDLGDEAGR